MRVYYSTGGVKSQEINCWCFGKGYDKIGVGMESEVSSGAAAGSAPANSEKKASAGIIPAGDKRKKFGDKGLWAVFGVLCAAIVGLGVGIFVVVGRGDKVDDSTTANNDAAMMKDSITERLETDPNYNITEAEEEFEIKIANSKPEEKVAVAIWYADFIYEQTEDAIKAIDALKNVEQFVNDENRVDYYVMLEFFYNEVGDETNAGYYRGMIDELVPDIAPMDGDTRNE